MMKIKLCTVSNQAYLPGLMVLLSSIEKHFKFSNWDLSVIYSNNVSPIDKADRELIEKIFPFAKFECIDDEKYKTKTVNEFADNSAYLTLETFNQPGYDRVCFVDSDMICMNDFSEVFAKDYSIMGCAAGRLSNQIGIRSDKTAMNTGFFVIDKRVNNPQVYEDLVSMVKKNTSTKLRDQEIINRYFIASEIYFLPMEFNYRNWDNFSQFVFDYKNIKFIHYSGYLERPKPWNPEASLEVPANRIWFEEMLDLTNRYPELKSIYNPEEKLDELERVKVELPNLENYIFGSARKALKLDAYFLDQLPHYNEELNHLKSFVASYQRLYRWFDKARKIKYLFSSKNNKNVLSSSEREIKFKVARAIKFKKEHRSREAFSEFKSLASRLSQYPDKLSSYEKCMFARCLQESFQVDERCLQIAYEALRSSHQWYDKDRNAFHHILNFIWNFQGATPDLISICLDISNVPDARDFKFWSTFAAILFEAGQLSQCTKVMAKLMVQSPRAIDHFLGLNKFACDYLANTKAHIIQGKIIFDKLHENKNSLEDLMKKHINDLVIVGSSPSEKGKGNGVRINEKTRVFRFGNYLLGSDYASDYGAKEDVWVHNLTAKSEERDLSKINNIVLKYINLEHRNIGSDRKGRLQAYVKQQACFFSFPTPVFHELYKILKAPPSTGLLMCYLYYKVKGQLEEGDTYGFSFYQQSGERHYFDSTPPDLCHAWHREKQLYEMMHTSQLIDERIEFSESYSWLGSST